MIVIEFNCIYKCYNNACQHNYSDQKQKAPSSKSHKKLSKPSSSSGAEASSSSPNSDRGGALCKC